MVPTLGGLSFRQDDEDDDNDYEHDAYVAEMAEVQNEIWEEMSSDADDWHRSEEGGWYYED